MGITHEGSWEPPQHPASPRAHLQLLGRGSRHRDQLLQEPRLPQRVDLLVPLQDRFLPEVDPDNAGMFPLGIRQVPQDAAQGLRKGWPRVMGELGADLGSLPDVGSRPSPWSWAVPSHRRAFWAPFGSWPRSSPWQCSADPGRSAHPPPGTEQCPGKGCPFPPSALQCTTTHGPCSGQAPRPFQQQHPGLKVPWLHFQGGTGSSCSTRHQWPQPPPPRPETTELLPRLTSQHAPDTSTCTGISGHTSILTWLGLERSLKPSSSILAEDASRTWTQEPETPALQQGNPL